MITRHFCRVFLSKGGIKVSKLFKNRYGLNYNELQELRDMFEAHCTAKEIMEDYPQINEDVAIKLGYQVRELMSETNLCESEAIKQICKKSVEETVKKIAEEKGWQFKAAENNYEFYNTSPAGQDFSFAIDFEDVDGLDEIIDKIYEAYNDFDCSYETYLWIGEDGHGVNGAPYEMIDVYKDMECCEQMILDLHDALNDSKSEKTSVGEKNYVYFVKKISTKDFFELRPGDIVFIMRGHDVVKTKIIRPPFFYNNVEDPDWLVEIEAGALCGADSLYVLA